MFHFVLRIFFYFSPNAHSEPAFRFGGNARLRPLVFEYSVVRDRPGVRLRQASPEGVTGTGTVCTIETDSDALGGISVMFSSYNFLCCVVNEKDIFSFAGIWSFRKT
jgi:hypothetical protein